MLISVDSSPVVVESHVTNQKNLSLVEISWEGTVCFHATRCCSSPVSVHACGGVVSSQIVSVLALVQRHGEVRGLGDHYHPIPGRRGHALTPGRVAARHLTPVTIDTGDLLTLQLYLIVTGAVDSESVTVTDSVSWSQISLPMFNTWHQTRSQTPGSGDAPLTIIFTRGCLLDSLKLHPFITPEIMGDQDQEVAAMRDLNVMTLCSDVLPCSTQPLGMTPSLLGPGSLQLISTHRGSAPLQD